MNKMTLGKRLTLGFALLIGIAMLLGSLAVFSMRSVGTLANRLATQYVPEAEIANALEKAVATVQLAIRSYGFTAEDVYLVQARKALATVSQQQQAAQALADRHPELVKLREHLKDLDPLVKGWVALIDQTEAKNKEITADRNKMDKAASDFVINIDRLIASQEKRLEKEIAEFTEASRLQQRRVKLALANKIRGDGNAARIAAFKSQALREPKVIEAGLTNFAAMDERFASLRAMLTVAEDIAELDRVKADAALYCEAMKEIMADSAALDEIGTKRVETAGKVSELASETAATGTARTVEAANTSTSRLSMASWTMVIGLALATVGGIVVALLIARSTNRVLTGVASALGDGADQVASAAGQVSSSSQSLAEGASEQAASLEETSASIEEMSSMTKRNASSSQEASELSKQARHAAERGATDMQTMNQAMADITTSSNDIAKIIKTIDEIAFQTNILALNAAVEAARAGEAGMGFAVVADEVRNLAQRSAQAAKETASKIEGAIDKTAQGVEISRKVGEALGEIVGKVRQVDELVAAVAMASKEQFEGISQVNVAVAQMDKLTQQNAASAEESASAAEELNAQAAVMNQSVGELLQLVGSARDGARTSPAKPPGKRLSSAIQRLTSPATVRGSNGDGGSDQHGDNGARPARLPAKSASPVAAKALHASFQDF